MRWDREWSRPDFNPEWRGGPIPQELREAVERSWFPPGGAILDIGCGDGRHARWLAEAGYEVLGIDYAAAAIAKATALHRDSGQRLAFTTMDICRQRPDRQFDALLDRGTLRLVEPRLVRQYLRNAAAAVERGGKFLLVYPTVTRRKEFRGAQEKKARVLRELQPLLEPVFETERIEDTVLGEVRDGQPFARGVALWLTRR
jgi:SAM-dependent methyltransferase